MSVNSRPIEIEDVQGLVLSGYAHLNYGAYLFLTFGAPNETKAWLRALIPQIATGAAWPKDASGKTIKPDSALTLSFTYTGLEALALPQEALESFPLEFRAGITDAGRSRILGDTGDSAPQYWDVCGDATQTHALLIVLADSTERLTALVQQHSAALEQAGGRVSSRIDGAKLPDNKEHFGYKDGISQPRLPSSARTSDVAEVRIAPGEFVMGYTNQYGQMPSVPTLNGEDLGRNGSYLVFRKLYQDVAAFWNFVAHTAAEFEAGNRTPEEQRIWLASKFVGRWPSGAPLALYPDKDEPNVPDDRVNTFLYRKRDPHGDDTPISSHVRRANPRDSNGPTGESALVMADRHQIIRRGMPYGVPLFPLEHLPPPPLEDDGLDRGLIFMCFNTNISRQFEFVQQTWLNNTKFHGLYTDKDPIVSDNDGRYTHTIPRNPVRQQVTGVPRFVKVKGGAYLFTPGLAALQRLAN